MNLTYVRPFLKMWNNGCMNNLTTVISKTGQSLMAVCWADGTRMVYDMHGRKGPVWHMPLLVKLARKISLLRLSTWLSQIPNHSFVVSTITQPSGKKKNIIKYFIEESYILTQFVQWMIVKAPNYYSEGHLQNLFFNLGWLYVSGKSHFARVPWHRC